MRDMNAKLQSFQKIFQEADESAGITRIVPQFSSTVDDLDMEDDREFGEETNVEFQDDTLVFRTEHVGLYVKNIERDWRYRKLKRKSSSSFESFQDLETFQKLRKLFTIVDWEEEVYENENEFVSQRSFIDKQRQCLGSAIVKFEWENAIEWDRHEIDIRYASINDDQDELYQLVRPEISYADRFMVEDLHEDDSSVEEENRANKEHGESNDAAGADANGRSNMGSETSQSDSLNPNVAQKEEKRAAPMSKTEREHQMLVEKAERLAKVKIEGSGDHDVALTIKRMAEGKKAAIDEKGGIGIGRSFATVLEHTKFAERHLLCKPDLLTTELRNFHRPRLVTKMKQRPWDIVFHKPQKTQGGRSRVKNKDSIENISIVEGDFMLVEYIEECPPMIMNPGMASKIINYHRASNEDGQESQFARMKKVQETFKKLDENGQYLPRHVRSLIEKESKEMDGGAKTQDTSLQFPEGKLEVLDDKDRFPFLGQLEKGQRQQSIATNFFTAPIFPHDLVYNDFLLIRTKISPNITFTIRKFDRVFLCGQLEPARKVLKPIQRTILSKEQEDYITLHIIRKFHQHFEENPHGGGVRLSTIKDMFRVSNKFKPSHSDFNLKKIMRQFALEVNEQWYLKDFTVDNKVSSPLEQAEKLKRFSLEELETCFDPEFVCLQESCNANEARLLDVGIKNIEISKLELWLKRMVVIKTTYGKRCKYFKRILDSNNRKLTADIRKKITKFFILMERRKKKIVNMIERARFIFASLAVASWNTTEAFIDSLGHPKLELENKIVDPSGGRHEAFAYIKRDRVIGTSKRPKVKAIESTERDLRKMRMPELKGRLIDMGIAQGDLASLGRWDLVHLIKELASRAVQDDVADDMQKFARKAKVTGHMKTEDYVKQAAEIWKNQVSALRSTQKYLKRDSDSDDDDNLEDDDDDDDDDLDDDEDYDITSGDRTSEAAELSALKNITAAPSVEFPTGSSSSGSHTVGDIGTDGSIRTLQDILGPDWVRPTKVVKKIERYIRSDGKECIRVKFILTSSEVARVERDNIKNKTGKYGVLPQTISARAELVRGRSRADSITETSVSAPVTAATHNLLDKSNKTLRQKSSIHSNFQTSSKSSELQLYKFEFNARLEKMLVEVFAWPTAGDFRYPVPQAVPNYYRTIDHPISLSDIRTKLYNLHYTTLAAFMSDIRLMASNAAKFNGSNSQLAGNAYSIVQHFQNQIDYDKNHQLHDLLRDLETNISMVEMADAAETNTVEHVSSSVDKVHDSNDIFDDTAQNDDLFGSDSDSGEEEVMESSHTLHGGNLQDCSKTQLNSNDGASIAEGGESYEIEGVEGQTEVEMEVDQNVDDEDLFGDDSDDEAQSVQEMDM